MVKLIICLVVPNLIYFVVYFKTSEFKYGLKAVLRTFKLEKRIEVLLGNFKSIYMGAKNE